MSSSFDIASYNREQRVRFNRPSDDDLCEWIRPVVSLIPQSSKRGDLKSAKRAVWSLAGDDLRDQFQMVMRAGDGSARAARDAWAGLCVALLDSLDRVTEIAGRSVDGRVLVDRIFAWCES